MSPFVAILGAGAFLTSLAGFIVFGVRAQATYTAIMNARLARGLPPFTRLPSSRTPKALSYAWNITDVDPANIRELKSVYRRQFVANALFLIVLGAVTMGLIVLSSPH